LGKKRPGLARSAGGVHCVHLHCVLRSPREVWTGHLSILDAIFVHEGPMKRVPWASSRAGTPRREDRRVDRRDATEPSERARRGFGRIIREMPIVGLGGGPPRGR
jgi:hypothetical protein